MDIAIGCIIYSVLSARVHSTSYLLSLFISSFLPLSDLAENFRDSPGSVKFIADIYLGTCWGREVRKYQLVCPMTGQLPYSLLFSFIFSRASFALLSPSRRPSRDGHPAGSIIFLLEIRNAPVYPASKPVLIIPAAAT